MEAEGECLEPWAAVAHRGQFSMTVYTPARAMLERIPMHPKATITVLLSPDGGESFQLGFIDAGRLQAFVKEMRPRTVSCLGLSDADEKAFRQLLWQGADDDSVIEMLRWRSQQEAAH